MLQIRQLEAFRAVAATGNVTLAAQQLQISQPAVSRLMNSLVKTLGFPVLVREGGRLVPTQEARFLLVEIDRVMAGMRNITKISEDILERKIGHLRITCLPGFATTHLPKIIAQFLQDRPGVTLVLEPDRPEHHLEWIISRQYDMAISADFPEHPAIESTSIVTRTVCILPPGHPLKDKPEITPRDLKGEPFIHTPQTSSSYRLVKTAFDADGVEMTPVIETRQFGAACRIVAAGTGVSIVNIIDALEYEKDGLIIKPFAPLIPYKMSLLYPAHMPRSILTMEFAELFIRSLQPYRIDTQMS